MRADIAARHRLRVKQRRRIVEYAREHGIKPAGRLCMATNFLSILEFAMDTSPVVR